MTFSENNKVNNLLYTYGVTVIAALSVVATVYILNRVFDDNTIENPNSVSQRPYFEEPYLIEDPYVPETEWPVVTPKPTPKPPAQTFDPNSDLIYKAPPKKETLLDSYIKKATKEEDIDIALATEFYLSSEFDEPNENGDVFATFHVRYPTSFANVSGGLPCIVKPTSRPLVNSVFRVNWVTEWVPSFPEGGAEDYTTGPEGHWTVPSIRTLQPTVRPDKQTALFVSVNPPSGGSPIPGGEGAVLQCPPDYVLVPDRMEHLPSSMDEGKFIQFNQDYNGRIQLFVRCDPIMNGLNVWIQLVVADRRVDVGLLPTPMLEIHIGNK